MHSLSLAFLPLALWWPVALGLSLLLVLSAVLWISLQHRRAQKQPAPAGRTSWLPWAFAIFALVWWGFGLALALWPLKDLDELGQWARASSYVLVPLWMGGVAWVCAFLVQRLLRTTTGLR